MVEFTCALEMECKRSLGSSEYVFYHPIQLDNFLITCWKTIPVGNVKSSASGSSSSSSFVSAKPSTAYSNNSPPMESYGDRYCCSIYEDGDIIIPSYDRRLRKFKWSKKTHFTKEELETMISDIVFSTGPRS
ncbi:hypothetical protein DFA_08301 [Cavenderia fasciculata]|uniref:Uncharacterized protein n=1 Tax=Cavenderia fasciculata TaxID=261658 RepID=F4Q5P9_CACFS|nr:uncharacterized protein DFA_08301 [Cavenderia fasciculata]EGG17308.1 hypothetical protein DFA_08301 [Cavenderia fasciculata]|eukprot:XP_004355792.1 hypothetical protein DFA_08301 [Cavenderia fasciculata]